MVIARATDLLVHHEHATSTRRYATGCALVSQLVRVLLYILAGRRAITKQDDDNDEGLDEKRANTNP